MILFTVVLILRSRIYKIIEEKKTARYQELLNDFVGTYIFEEDEDFKARIDSFRLNYLKGNFEQEIAIKIILNFAENLKGESREKAISLFYEWKLLEKLRAELNSSKWHRKAKAIHTCCSLQIWELSHLIEPFLNSSKTEVRQQALLYFIHRSPEDPLNFLDKIEFDITLWEQIFIQYELQNNYKGDIPDFSPYLKHTLNSVKIFAMKIIAEFNQFENSPNILPFIEDENENLRQYAIECLIELQEPAALGLLKGNFALETSSVQYTIIEYISKLGSSEDFEDIQKFISQCDWINRLKYYKNSKILTPEIISFS
ncbi:hypothetical protein DHD80_16215 [Gramella sp. AN32]|nr:hypothetical protein [Gramella sp. AN32]